jgi:hypothetical protein
MDRHQLFAYLLAVVLFPIPDLIQASETRNDELSVARTGR